MVTTPFDDAVARLRAATRSRTRHVPADPSRSPLHTLATLDRAASSVGLYETYATANATLYTGTHQYSVRRRHTLLALLALVEIQPDLSVRVTLADADPDTYNEKDTTAILEELSTILRGLLHPLTSTATPDAPAPLPPRTEHPKVDPVLDELLHPTPNEPRSLFAKSLSSLPPTWDLPQEPDTTASWVPLGTTTSIHARPIPGPYYQVERTSRRDTNSQSTINTSLSVDPGVGDYTQFIMYAPHYSKLDPQGRRNYLTWMAQGRSDPRAYIGYVFLYFYGIEWRIIYDLDHASPGPELFILRAEVQRLREVYGKNRSFSRYAQRLLVLINAIAFAAGVADFEPDVPRSPTPPTELLAAIGRAARAGEFITPSQILLLLRAISPSFPTQRNNRAKRLEELFAQRYTERYTSYSFTGPKLRVPYHPCATKLTGRKTSYRQPRLDVPNISLNRALMASLNALVRECARDTTLPASLRRTDVAGESAPAKRLRAWVNTTLASSLGVPTTDLIDALELAPDAPVTPALWGTLSKGLSTYHVGFEPDARYGGTDPSLEGHVVLFRGAEPLRPGYQLAAALLQVAAPLLPTEEDITDPSSVTHAFLTTTLGLNAPEVLRAHALLEELASNGPRDEVDLTKLKDRPRRAFAVALIQLVTHDGPLNQEDITALEAAYSALSLPATDLNETLRALSVPDPTATFTLDPEKIRESKENTATLAELLTEVFAEEVLPTAPAAITNHPLGLDVAHNQLLNILLTRPVWESEELEHVVQEAGLPFVRAALDTLNDAFLDEFETELITGEGPYALDQELVQEYSK